jgi:glutamate-1-semialdehyde 2,1-aminomutase
LEGLRAACDEAGALLIFDEVITGFRVGPGGASTRLGVRPDLWTFGKVIGGGLPLAAFGGRRHVMEVLAPVGPVYQAGTLSGNPIATAAGLAVLDLLDAGAYARLEATAIALADGLAAALEGVAVVPRFGPLVGLFFGTQPVTNYDEAKASCGTGAYAGFFRRMLEAGIALAPGPYEALFPSLAHTAEDVARTVEAARP